MSDREKDDYEVGYGRPPKHSQFVPGQSGNKGRRRRNAETPAEIVARVRDEHVHVNGRWMTKLEIAVTTTLTQTIRSGKPRDLEALFKILDRYGALPEADQGLRAKEGAERAYKKIMDMFDRTFDVDPADTEELERLDRDEAALIMSCSHCAPVLREQWSKPERKALSDRYGKTPLHRQVSEPFSVTDPWAFNNKQKKKK